VSKQVKMYFSHPGFRRLLDGIWKRYEALERIGGNVSLKRIAEDECEAINPFFGWNLKVGEDVSVPLALFEKELRDSRFCIGIQELHEVLKGEPLLTKHEKQLLADQSWRKLFQTVRDQVGLDIPTLLMDWLVQVEQGRGAGARTLRDVYKSDPEVALESLGIVVRALREVLARSEGEPPVRMPVLAVRVSGDAHALDGDRPAGRMLTAFLSERLTIGEEAEGGDDGAATLKRREMYRRFGILDDDLSSIVHWFVPEKHTPIVPNVWTLRQVEAADFVYSCSHIYVVENPAVFSSILDAIPAEMPFQHHPPALICTSGPASAAAIRWIQRCLANSPGTCNIYYSGDFDGKGLSMGLTLAALFPDRYVPWRFDSATYRTVVNRLPGPSITGEEQERLLKLPMIWDPSLCKIMYSLARKVHQESFAELLVGDYLAAITHT